jgi:hypothetical protein
MGTRITSRALEKIVRDARALNAGVPVSFIAQAVEGNKQLKFYGIVDVDGTEYDLAGDNGKLKLFTDADDYVKYIATAAPMGTGDYAVTISTGLTLAASVPNDLVAWATKQIAKLQTKKTAQQTVLANINAQLALMVGWESGSPLQVAKKVETTTQRDAVQADIDAIDAEITRLS